MVFAQFVAPSGNPVNLANLRGNFAAESGVGTSPTGAPRMTSNLWLCLSCGKLHCGRRNFDGTGGNGHAMDHGKRTGHSVVCKMGTITAEGKADVYCYGCDDEKVDPIWREGMPATTPARTLVDVADELQPEQVAMAVQQALNLGLLTRRQLER